MLIDFIMGDWSRDGHNQSESVVCECNLSVKEITQAYKKGVKTIGFDLVSDVAEAYEDNRLSWEHLQKLRIAGFKGELDNEMSPEEADDENKNNLYKYYTYQTGAALNTETFLKIYMFFVKVGNPNFEYKLAVRDTDNIKIGGYGLFN